MMQVCLSFGSCLVLSFFFVVGNRYISKVTPHTLSASEDVSFACEEAGEM